MMGMCTRRASDIFADRPIRPISEPVFPILFSAGQMNVGRTNEILVWLIYHDFLLFTDLELPSLLLMYHLIIDIVFSSSHSQQSGFMHRF